MIVSNPMNLRRMSVTELLPTLQPLSREDKMKVMTFLGQELGIHADDQRCLTGLSLKELRALSECRLTVSEQERMSDLLDRNSNGQLSVEEKIELATLVDQADQLSLLKTRAQYTLYRLAA
jgi:hypothetical protein